MPLSITFCAVVLAKNQGNSTKGNILSAIPLTQTPNASDYLIRCALWAEPWAGYRSFS